MGKSSKDSSDEIQSIITEAKKNELKATIDWNNIAVNNTERLLKDIASGKIKKLKIGTVLLWKMMWVKYSIPENMNYKKN